VDAIFSVGHRPLTLGTTGCTVGRPLFSDNVSLRIVMIITYVSSYAVAHVPGDMLRANPL